MFEPIDTNILFKYRDDSEYTESIIKEHALWFSSPFAFNDPFDCWSVVKDATDEQKRQKIDELKKKNTFVKYAVQNHPEVLNQNLQPSNLKTCADSALSRIRICSFSRNCDNILMWSHYAKEHTGMCFMFDFGEDTMFLKYCSRINYVSKITPSDVITESGRKKLVENCVFSKYKDWSYEEEVRSIKFGRDVQQNIKGENYGFTPKTLKKIIFGCRTSDETIKKYVSLCQEHEMQHVVFSKMKQKEDGTFGLIEEKI